LNEREGGMPLSAQLREQLFNSFRSEAAEYVQSMTDGLLALEQGTPPGEARTELLETVFRAAHSLKGAARAIGLAAVEQLAHALESALADVQHERLAPSPALFSALYAVLDAIQDVPPGDEQDGAPRPPSILPAIAQLDAVRYPALPAADQGSPPPPALQAEPAAATLPAETQPVAPALAGETIRVSAAKLDALMNQLGELLVTKIRTEQRLGQLRQAQDHLAGWQKDWLLARSAYGRLARETVRGGNGAGRNRDEDVARLLQFTGASQERLRTLGALVDTLAREYAGDTLHTALVIDALEQEIKRVRLLPLTTITGPFARMVRDLAQATGKAVVFQVTGSHVELDKRVLEQIRDPLIHLLRNAVDHGIETPAEREARGKPRQGLVTLDAEQLGKDVLVRVADDGAGLNFDAIRHAIARRGGDGENLDEDELKEWIFRSGVSTSTFVTDVSGRGVGLDVVRRNVEALRGRIDVSSASGHGTIFTLVLPLTLTSTHGLLVKASGQLFALPLGAIERILHAAPEDIAMLEGREALRYDGRLLTLMRLGDVLDLPAAADRMQTPRAVVRSRQGAYAPADGRLVVLVLTAADRRMAFVVDGLAGEQEIVIKGLGPQLARVGGIAGATLMGNGDVVLVLNVADLIRLALRAARRAVLEAPSQPARPRRRILVVDDSITTRTLEKNILEAAGYLVELATDGLEALSVISTGGVPDLIVSDVVMPRLNGIELARRVKGDTRTAEVPLILVTSLDSADDKARGMEAGADAYIVKSHFDQNNLLDTIAQFI
jgi:two-component system chemotaxis sensor kinase CheA